MKRQEEMSTKERFRDVSTNSMDVFFGEKSNLNEGSKILH